jgi:predicted  nucleic acid-binding Zn-ribbon protein
VRPIPIEREIMGTYTALALEKIKRRIRRLEKRMANEVQDLATLKASVDAHNAADAQFQTDVNDKVAALEKAVADAGANTAAVDAAIADLKSSVDGLPTLTVPA